MTYRLIRPARSISERCSRFLCQPRLQHFIDPAVNSVIKLFAVAVGNFYYAGINKGIPLFGKLILLGYGLSRKPVNLKCADYPLFIV